MNQDDVVDASVWFEKGHMMAHVTLAEQALWTEGTLLKTCQETIGKANTPEQLVLICARRRAA